MGANNHPTSVPKSMAREKAKEAMRDAGVNGIIRLDTFHGEKIELFGSTARWTHIRNSDLPDSWGVKVAELEGTRLWIGVGPL